MSICTFLYASSLITFSTHLKILSSFSVKPQMAELGITIAAKLIEVMGTEIIKEICDMWGYKSHLEDLHKTVSTIKNVLLDADAKRELSKVQQGYIAELKAAVYDADDLFDEFLTLAERDQIDGNRVGGKLAYKVRRFFSSNKKKLGQAYRMAHKVKDLRKKLDAIADDHSKFGLSVDYKPICRRREETCSYVDANDIVGRDQDKEKVINMLLDPDCCFLTIVGVGGLGKTALAQLVFNDGRIKKEFPDEKYRLWVCVSDQDGEQFDVKSILCKILGLISPDQKFDGSSSLQLVQMQFREKLGQRKYLLVLDDVWNEDREKWVDLKKFLMLGQEGSRILVTTRSEMTVNIIDAKYAYKLEGLSEEDSWRLFEMSAFQRAHEQENYDELVKIGRKVVENCHCNPLAIKVVGSLLYGQHINKWQSFAMVGLAGISKGESKIMSILKLSYHNLEPSLKSCFSYCALFPKDFEFQKELLIGLWMAQGYIVPLDDGQSLDDAAEEHFLILLRRCFFQDVLKDALGDVEYVKIHDLMHDIALEVGREEIHIVNSMVCEDQLGKYGDKIRHVRYVGNENIANSLSGGRIRSCIYCPTKRIQIENWVSLRMLDLSCCDIGSLPDSIDKLLFLRYLNMSGNYELNVLPDSITKLHNLETLILDNCGLREFPREFCKLVKLRHLDIKYCYELAYMPSGMDKLTNLRMLTDFVVGRRNPVDEEIDDELKALKVLTKIKGHIMIHVGENYRHDKVERMNESGIGYLNRLEHLRGVSIFFCEGGQRDNHERFLEDMEPHPNLKILGLQHYEGRRIPRWGRAKDNWAVSLPLLVHIYLYICKRLQQIPSFSQLRHLKSLRLWKMLELEYMEDRCGNDTEVTLFFPSLEFLELRELDKLKGWWKEEGLVVDDGEDHLLRSRFTFRFPRLSKLIVSSCPNLASFPPCPNLEELELEYNNKRLQIIVKDDTTAANSQHGFKLRKAIVDNVANLKSLPAGSIHSLHIKGDEDMESFSKFGEEFIKSHAWSLQSLSIERCNNMTSLPKQMQHFTLLKELRIIECRDVKALPEWISSLSSLKSLEIIECPALKSLPEEMRNLTSLQFLYIIGCPELQERCSRETNGEDYPKIQHIPKISISIF